MDSAQQERIDRTYRWDLTRGVLHGVLETIWMTFAILVAIRIYQSPEMLKPLVPSSFALGYLVAPLGLWALCQSGMRLSGGLAASYAGGGVMLALAAVSNTEALYFAAVVAALVCFAQGAPFLTSIYSENYPATQRGQRLSTNLVLSAISGACAAWAGGWIMDTDVSRWRWFFFFASGVAFMNCLIALRIPSDRPAEPAPLNPFRNLSYAWKDRVFGRLLFGWMLIGLGNLMTLPVRVEYVANPEYGVIASNEMVALMTVTIPRVFSILSVKVWGWVFDRSNLIAMRVAINCFFLGSILLYFLTTNLYVIGLAAVLLGVATGGGGVIWPLWVTRIAPTGRVSAYMSVHTALTGVRGIGGPFLGFYLIAQMSPHWVAYTGAGLILVSTFVFVPMHKRLGQHAA